MNGLQNRKTVAVLIVLAAGLWGGILWRLVRYTGEGKAVAPAYSPPSPVAPVGKDTLRLNYRDPFVEVLPEPEYRFPGLCKPLPLRKSLLLSVCPGSSGKGKKSFCCSNIPTGACRSGTKER